MVKLKCLKERPMLTARTGALLLACLQGSGLRGLLCVRGGCAGTATVAGHVRGTSWGRRNIIEAMLGKPAKEQKPECKGIMMIDDDWWFVTNTSEFGANETVKIKNNLMVEHWSLVKFYNLLS